MEDWEKGYSSCRLVVVRRLLSHWCVHFEGLNGTFVQLIEEITVGGQTTGLDSFSQSSPLATCTLFSNKGKLVQSSPLAEISLELPQLVDVSLTEQPIGMKVVGVDGKYNILVM
ncbi:UNVERIFIED_CONTAM: hypothetical protein Sindi_0992700 [Sesamum indicum]